MIAPWKTRAVDVELQWSLAEARANVTLVLRIHIDDVGAPGRIRTCGLWLRRPTLYPAELRARMRNREWRMVTRESRRVQPIVPRPAGLDHRFDERSESRGERRPAASACHEVAGAPGRTRTCDLRIRSPALYPTELRAHEQASYHPSVEVRPARDHRSPATVTTRFFPFCTISINGVGTACTLT